MRKLLSLAALLSCSGGCALIYQSVWLREFRLVFGASTMASAAVIAIFMGGLGAGSIILGAKADRARRPIGFYSFLELGITCAAAVSPFLLDFVRSIFLSLGGGFQLGPIWGTAIRLLLSTLVLAVPTFLMGGTLPALARAAETSRDLDRKFLAFLYGANTLGAVVGVMLSNFWMFEHLGNRVSLWSACLINGLVVIAARQLSRGYDDGAQEEAHAAVPASGLAAPQSSRTFVIWIAGIVGFAFLFMEIVWYRMLGPILGGTTFTFGVILAVALAGIGLGGLLYPLVASRLKPSFKLLSFVCAAEALFIAIPFALGDRLAEAAWLLRSAQTFGFVGQVSGWVVICGFVVFPAAVIAGIQFPLLIALLGKGREQVGKDTGLIYIANTAGSILGSLAGGFGLLPLLSATGAWRAIAVVLAVLALLIVLYARSRSFLAPITALAALIIILAPGPSAVWRHAGIGAGRAGPFPTTANERRGLEYQFRRSVLWQSDGVESGVAVIRGDGMAFAVNGKVDGHIYTDAGTQIMSGMLGSLFHPDPKSYCVVGLGTGSTAGWLGALPRTERVDVIELEPDIAQVARDCAAANCDVLSNKKVNLVFGDGREWLLTTKQRYDIIFSEPSNPYRAGIASLFTQDFYRAAVNRLTENGIFAQWVQAYEVDSEAICSVYGTFLTVFPHVQSWQTLNGDVLLLGSLKPLSYDIGLLQKKIAEPGYKDALVSAWRTATVEGIFARYIGGDLLAHAAARGAEGRVNTDDLTSLEFAFGRSVGKQQENRQIQLRALSAELKDNRPKLTNGQIDWESVDRQVAIRFPSAGASKEQLEKSANKLDVLQNVTARNFARAAELWKAKPWEPDDLLECSVIALALAKTNDPNAERMIAQVEGFSPTEAKALRAMLLLQQGKPQDSVEELIGSFELARKDPWPSPMVMAEALNVATEVAKTDKALAIRLDAALVNGFAVYRMWDERRLARTRIATATEVAEANPRSLAAVKDFEPYPLWDRTFLSFRLSCYKQFADPLVSVAERELATYNHDRDRSIKELVITPQVKMGDAGKSN